jgi:prepilin-type N-terminal cleavage/methylation domain-containing protein
LEKQVRRAVPASNTRGITLLEMLLVVTLIGLLGSVTYPAFTSGIESLRLLTASDSVASFLNAALNRAERRQELIELTISRGDSKLALRSTEPGWSEQLDLPDGIRITAVHPEAWNQADEDTRRIYFYPGGTAPRIGVEISNRRGVSKIVRVDPVGGVPEVETIVPEAK